MEDWKCSPGQPRLNQVRRAHFSTLTPHWCLPLCLPAFRRVILISLSQWSSSLPGFSGQWQEEGEVEGQQGVPADKDALRWWWVTQSAELISATKGGSSVPLFSPSLQSSPSLSCLLPLCLSSPLLSRSVIRWWGIHHQHSTDQDAKWLDVQC